MPLANGYSEKTLHQNIGEMTRAGRHTRAQALAAAYNHARACYFKVHPHGVLPRYLWIPGKDQRRAAFEAFSKK